MKKIRVELFDRNWWSVNCFSNLGIPACKDILYNLLCFIWQAYDARLYFFPEFQRKDTLETKPGLIKRKIIFDLVICLIKLVANKWRNF